MLEAIFENELDLYVVLRNAINMLLTEKYLTIFRNFPLVAKSGRVYLAHTTIILFHNCLSGSNKPLGMWDLSIILLYHS